MLSERLKDNYNDINALDAFAVAQKSLNTDWCANLMRPPRTSKKRPRGDDREPTAEESEYMDVLDLEDSVDGSDGDIGNELAVSEEMDAGTKRGEDKLVLSEGHAGVVYDQLHGLTPDADWWRSYLV
jgi:hypothetical protein